MEKSIITHWVEQAQVDYADLYARLFIAYNAWFKKVTNADSDYEAIRKLCFRFVIWDDYLHGKTLVELGPLMSQIAILTHHRPLLSGERWGGSVADKTDWKGLIYFWYQTRCDLFHGTLPPKYVYQVIQIKLAYESLNLFMQEIVKRMGTRVFEDNENSDFEQKSTQSTGLWNVDMQRV